MRLQDIFRISRAFNDLGWSVQEQLSQFLDESTTADLNSNAVDLFERWIKDVQRTAQNSGDEQLRDSCDYALEQIAEDRHY